MVAIRSSGMRLRKEDLNRIWREKESLNSHLSAKHPSCGVFSSVSFPYARIEALLVRSGACSGNALTRATHAIC